jgi:hypothetical protein
MRKLLTVAAVAIIAVLAAFVPASAAPAANPQVYPACDNHFGVEYSTKIAYECLYSETGGGILYWAVNKFVATYYFNPYGTSGMVATESYFRTCAQDVALGQACPQGFPLLPQSNGRIITLADGCLVSAPSQSTVPNTCLPTSLGGQPGTARPMNATETATITAFYAIMHKTVSDNEW